MEKKYLPAYYEGRSWGFRHLAKQVFWLVDLELMIKEKHGPHNFKEMAKRIKDKNHIIHDAIKIRKMKTTKNHKLRKDFIKKLKRYLNSLKKLT